MIQVGLLTNWKQIAVLNLHTMAIKTDGTLWSWGLNSTLGELGLGDTVSRSFPTQITSYSSSPSTYSVRIFNGNDWIRLPTTAASASGIGIGLAGYFTWSFIHQHQLDLTGCFVTVYDSIGNGTGQSGKVKQLTCGDYKKNGYGNYDIIGELISLPNVITENGLTYYILEKQINIKD